MTAQVKIGAKINLSLNILGRFADGFHSLDMVVASVDLYDYITVSTRQDKKITLQMKGKIWQEMAQKIPNNCNTAYQVATDFMHQKNTCGFDIIVEKNIPIGAGLGGSSVDAGGVLSAIGILVGQDKKSLRSDPMTLQRGSDIPYMMEGGFARVKSRGECLTFLHDICPLFFVICQGKNQISSAKSYQKFDQIFPSFSYSPSDNDRLISALKNGDLMEIASQMNNALLPASLALDPSLSQTQALLQPHVLATTMTGSGSAFIGLCHSQAHAQEVEKTLSDKLPFVKACACEQQK